MHLSLQRPSRSYVLWTIALIIVVEGLLGCLFLIPGVQFDNKVGVALFATVPAFVITIIQLLRTQQVQRAGYIKDFLTEFRKNTELYTAYYDLVYRYRDEVFDKVMLAAAAYLQQKPKPTAAEKPVFDCFRELQVSTEPGSRFFHPLFFQFSLEEKRFDGLLDYFNTIGLYLYEGLIRIEDIVTILGDYLAVLADRKIVVEYLRVCDDRKEWKYEDSVGASTPFQHLRFLLESYQEYNLEEFHRLRMEQVREATERKRREVDQRRKQLKGRH